MDWRLVLQIAGFVLGLLYLWLEYRADIRLWIVGLIMPLVHGTLYYTAGLYADSAMQVYYVLAGVYGWIVWHTAQKKMRAAQAGHSIWQQQSQQAEAAGQKSAHKHSQAEESVERPSERKKSHAGQIGHTPLRQVAGLVAVYIAAHAGIYFLLTEFTNSTVPFWDAMTTAGSIVAMWMLSRKYVEQWLVWLVVDLVCVGLYIYKEIPFTAGLYALYSVLAVAGYLRWRKKMKEQISV